MPNVCGEKTATTRTLNLVVVSSFITCSQLRKIPILTDTLLGTNIFHPFPFQDTFEDDVPFPKVGYVSFR